MTNAIYKARYKKMIKRKFTPTITLEECTDFYKSKGEEIVKSNDLDISSDRFSKLKSIKDFFEVKKIFQKSSSDKKYEDSSISNLESSQEHNCLNQLSNNNNVLKSPNNIPLQTSNYNWIKNDSNNVNISALDIHSVQVKVIPNNNNNELNNTVHVNNNGNIANITNNVTNMNSTTNVNNEMRMEDSQNYYELSGKMNAHSTSNEYNINLDENISTITPEYNVLNFNNAHSSNKMNFGNEMATNIDNMDFNHSDSSSYGAYDQADSQITDYDNTMTDWDDSELTIYEQETFMERLKIESQKLFLWDHHKKESVKQNFQHISSKIQNQATVLHNKLQNATMNYKNHNMKNVIENFKIQKEKVKLAVRDLETRFQNMPAVLPRKRVRMDESIEDSSGLQEDKLNMSKSVIQPKQSFQFTWKHLPCFSSDGSRSITSSEKSSSFSKGTTKLESAPSLEFKIAAPPPPPAMHNIYAFSRTQPSSFLQIPPTSQMATPFQASFNTDAEQQRNSIYSQDLNGQNTNSAHSPLFSLSAPLQSISNLSKKIQGDSENLPHLYRKIFQASKQSTVPDTSSDTDTAMTPSKINIGAWTKDEHDAFVSGYKQFGKQWNKIAALIPSRTRRQIISHAQKFLKKENQSIDSSTLKSVQLRFKSIFPNQDHSLKA